MMKRWADTFPKSGPTTTSVALSIAAHAALIGWSVVATMTPNIERYEIAEVNIIARFLAPPNTAGGQTAQREQIKFVAFAEPADVQPGTRPRLQDEPVPAVVRQNGVFQQTVEAREQIQGPDSVFTSLEVDSAATRFAWSAAPAYPQAMLEVHREGVVKARWIVDEAGYADTASLEIVDYTTPEFAKSVRDALPFMRFSPAKMGSKAVRQLVEQEFAFRISTVMVAPPQGSKKPPT